MTMARSVPPWLSAVLQELELERPALVTTGDLRDILMKVGNTNPAKLVAQHLSERGWLLATPSPGVWEFAPGDRAGGFSSGSPFLPLRAALARDPGLDAAAALESALWLHDLVDRVPVEHVVAVPSGVHAPVALRRHYRVIYSRFAFDTKLVHETPVMTLEATLLHVAAKPGDVSNWRPILQSLQDLVDLVDKDSLREALKGFSHSTQARFAYLLSGVDRQWVETLDVPRRNVVWFGDRKQQRRRYVSRWNVVDTVLPVDPSSLA